MRVIGLDVPKEEQNNSLAFVEELKEENKIPLNILEETEEEKKESPPIPEKRGRGRPKKTI